MNTIIYSVKGLIWQTN